MKSRENKEQSSPWLRNVSASLIGLGISAVFIALALRGVDIAQVQDHLSRINTGVLFPVLIILSLIFFLKAFRWQYQMSPLKRITFAHSFTSIIIGYMANNVVPMRGGDFLRAYLLGRHENVGTTTVLVTVALERVFDVLSLVTVSFVIIMIAPFPGWLEDSVIIVGSTLLGGTAGILVFHPFRKVIGRWWEKIHRALPQNIQEIVSGLIDQFFIGLKTATGKVRLTNLYILTLGELALWGLLTKFSLQALDIELSLAAIMTLVIATNLAVMLPAAPGYIGVFHYAVMMTLIFYQFDKIAALSGAVVLHAIFIIPASLMGLLFFIKGVVDSRRHYKM